MMKPQKSQESSDFETLRSIARMEVAAGFALIILLIYLLTGGLGEKYGSRKETPQPNSTTQAAESNSRK